jgi:hypothetical protein
MGKSNFTKLLFSIPRPLVELTWLRSVGEETAFGLPEGKQGEHYYHTK